MTTKEARLSLRLSIEDKKKIQKRAIDKNMKISEYVMSLVNEDLKKKEG